MRKRDVLCGDSMQIEAGKHTINQWVARTRGCMASTHVILVAVVLVAVFLSCTVTVDAQSAFGGDVVSVSTIDSCVDLPTLNSGQGGRPSLIYQPNTEEPFQGGDACSILGGEDQPFTNVILSLSAGQVSGADTLVFQLSGPSSGNAQPDGTDCYGTVDGADCQVFDGGQLLVSFETGQPVEVFDLFPIENIPYASFWHQYPPIDADSFSCSDCPPQSSTGSVFVEYLSTVTDAFDSNGNAIGDPVIVQAPGPVGDTGIYSVCPLPSELTGGAYSGAALYFPPVSSEGYPVLVTDDSSIPVLFAPTLTEFGTSGRTWSAGYSTQVGNTCTVNRINPAPSLLFNMRINLALAQDGSTGNSTQMLDDLNNSPDYIEISSAQDGILATDTSGQILAAMFDFSFVGSSEGQPLQGSLVTCGACDLEDTDSSIGCRNNLLSDYFCVNSDNGCGNLFSLSYTDNVYLTTPGGKRAVQEGCIFPVEYCRNVLANSDTSESNSVNNAVKGSWYYMNQQRTNLALGGGFGRIDQLGNFYATNLADAELMAMGGLNGTGIAGYQDVTLPEGRRFTAPVPCQTFLQAGLALDAQNNCDATDGSCSQSFAFGLPPDANGAVPLYQLDNLRLIRTIPGTGAFSAKVSLSVPGTYTGEIVTVSMGKIVSQFMLCSVPEDSSSGVISVTIRNTGTLPADYVASANFNSELIALPNGGFRTVDTQGEGDGSGDPDDTTDYTVQNSVPCTVGIDPGEVGTCLISFSYTGPQTTDLKATIILTAGVVRSNGDPIVLGVTQTECGITSSIDTSGPFGAISKGLLLGDGARNEDDLDEGNDFVFWRTVLIGGLALLVLIVGAASLFYCCFFVYQEAKTLENQVKAKRAYDNKVSLYHTSQGIAS